MPPPPPLLRLPPELQLEILTHLPVIDQVVTTQVCTTLRRLLSTKIFAQNRYVPVSLSLVYLKPTSETHSAFPRTHFLLEDSIDSALLSIVKGGAVVSYIYFRNGENTEQQDGVLWDGQTGSLDPEIKDAILKKQKEQSIDGKSTPQPAIAKEPGPGDPLDIDDDEWDALPVVFYAQANEILRLTGGRDLTNSAALDDPFISPFIEVEPLPDDTQAMEFNFELEVYKDDLLKGPGWKVEKEWEEKIVFKRTATVRDWIHGCLEKAYAEAMENGVTNDETIWAHIRIRRVWNKDAWSVRAEISRISVEARRGMVWVRRENGEFLLIKKEVWDERGDWDWDNEE